LFKNGYLFDKFGNGKGISEIAASLLCRPPLSIVFIGVHLNNRVGANAAFNLKLYHSFSSLSRPDKSVRIKKKTLLLVRSPSE